MDKQKQMMLIGGGVGVVVVALAVYLLFFRGGGEPAATEGGTGTAASQSGPAKNPGATASSEDPGGGGSGVSPTGGPKSGQMISGAPTGLNRPAQATPAGGAPGATPGIKVAAAPLPYKPRKDPFYVAWHTPPPPIYVFDEVGQPMRVASMAIPTPEPPNTVVREVPTLRVSGIMSGDGVFAILEGGPEVEIVKPGSQTKDGYQVVSINSDSVKLQKKVGNVTYVQTVTLSDVPTGAGPQPAAFGGQQGFGGRSGFPGLPGQGGGGRLKGGGGGGGLE